MKQIVYELKSQPVIAAVTIIGTALAIFLIMVVVMLQQVKLISIAPESDRDRMLYVSGAFFSKGQNSGNYALSAAVAKELGEDLPGAESVAIMDNYINSSVVSAVGRPAFDANVRQTDAGFFDTYNFRFIAGHPYNEADVNSHLNKAVISESTAREVAESPEAAVGKEITLDDVTYTIVAVVADVSPVTDKVFAQIWIPLAEEDPTDFWTSVGLGQKQLAIKARSADDFQKIYDEVSRRVDIIVSRHAEDEEFSFNIEGAPYAQEAETLHYSGRRPDLAHDRSQRLIVYAILLLIPAINLSSMTRSRLRRRVSEIGVRRAFGCTRTKVMFDILIENFFITLIGSLIGLLACIIFGSTLFDAIYTGGSFMVFSNVTAVATVGFSSLLNWSMFAYAVLFCFILNLLSTGIPAWRASRVNPVEAILSSNR